MRLRKLVAGVAIIVALGTSSVAAQSGYESAIYSACATYGCNGDQLVRVAACESGFDPNAMGIHGEIGIFQFMPSTYYAFGGTDIWNPYEQIEIAAQMWASGQGGHWICQ